MNLKKNPTPKEIELFWASKWESEGLYETSATNNSQRGSFCIQFNCFKFPLVTDGQGHLKTRDSRILFIRS